MTELGSQVVVFARRYVDSITLLALAAAMSECEGVERSVAVLATPGGLATLAADHFVVPSGTGQNDLLLGISGTAAGRMSAIARAECELAPPPSVNGAVVTQSPRSLDQWARRGGSADVAIVSVPGRFAASVARRALHQGMHCLIFSDNVSVSDEIELKVLAARKGLLAMGPDCGTAILDGIPLGFANAVAEGPIAVVGASGTGMQEVTTLIDRLGSGVSQAIGCGGRDLSDEVGGRTMLAALALLESDDRTSCIVLIAKQPGPSVMASLSAATLRLVAQGKSVVTAFTGLSQQPDFAHATMAASLADAAVAAVHATLGDAATPLPTMPVAMPSLASARRRIHGAFCGGTFAAECRAGLSGLPDVVVIDFGDDQYTVSRPHPMIDPTLRDRSVAAALADVSNAAIIFDVVLGQGAADDPIEQLLPILTAARHHDEGPIVVTNVCGTDRDRQDRNAVVRRLQEAGVLVAPSNAAAVRYIASVIGGRP